MRNVAVCFGLSCLAVLSCGEESSSKNGANAGASGVGATPAFSGSAGASSANGGALAQGGSNPLGGEASASGGMGGTAPQAAPRPNIIFVLVDDLGWGDLGNFYQNARQGTQKFVTPHLDEMADQGIQFRRHYSPAPVCAPSRASLLLGVHQGHSNIRDNQFDQKLDDNHTLATVLKGAGYATANIGKWGLQGAGGPAAQPSRPGLRGFDYFYGFISHKAGHYHYPEQMTGNDDQGQPLAILENTTDVTAELKSCYSTDFITARAKKWLVEQHEQKPEQPFFLYLTYTAPHAQLQVPTTSHLTGTSNYPEGGGLNGGVQWLGMPGKAINTAAGTIDAGIHPDYASKGWPPFAQRHASMVRRLDDAVADLMQLLKDLQIDEQTLVVFSSDNGAHNEADEGAIAQDPSFFRSYGPFEGIKRDVLEGGMRVPAIVRWPGHIAAGGINDAPSQFQDWMPTFAELAGVPKPARADGVSLVPTLLGPGAQSDSSVYVEYFFNGTTPNYADFVTHKSQARQQMQVVFMGGYKAERTNIAANADPFRIYDTLKDPAEATDLAGMPGVPTQAELQARVTQLRRVSASAARPYDMANMAAVSADAAKAGLDFKAYELAAPWVPDWETFDAAAEGETAGIELTQLTRAEDVGAELAGYLEVPTAGEYTFFLSTDTGAFVRLHDAQLIDADFGYTAAAERSSGPIRLAAGRHPIRIFYRHANGPEHTLSLSWQGPGIAKVAIPESAFFH